MQIETSVRHHYTPTQWLKLVTDNNKCFEDAEKPKLAYVEEENAKWYHTGSLNMRPKQT